MSWFLIAGTIVDMIERYDSLSHDAKYLLKQYIQESERKTFERSQRHGTCMAAHKACKMLADIVPGKKANYCWYCGTIEFFSDERTLEDMGWLKNFAVMYSGYLCPTCQKDERIKTYFLNPERDVDAIVHDIAKYGTHKTNRTQEEIEAMLKKAWDGGSPYGGPVENLDPSSAQTKKDKDNVKTSKSGHTTT